MRTINVRTAPRDRRSVLLEPICRLLPFLATIGSLVGCGSIEPVAPTAGPITDATQLYSSLTFDHPAVVLSLVDGYTTVHLTATPRDALGNPMTGLPAPSYRSINAQVAQVTADGLVTAVKATSEVEVIAELAAGPFRYADTAVVVVTDDPGPPPTLASLSIHPQEPDSTVWSMVPMSVGSGGVQPSFQVQNISNTVALLTLRPSHLASPQLNLRMLDDAGNLLEGLAVEYRSLNTAVATVDRRNGVIELIRPGQVAFVAQTMVYGVSKADTVTYTVTTPIVGTLSVEPGINAGIVFFMSSIRIAPYGLLGFINRLDDSVDVTFDDPANVIRPPDGVCNAYQGLYGGLWQVPGPFCGSGNVLLAPKGPPRPDRGFEGSEATLQIRQFPVPGGYSFHSVRTGAVGRVVVSAQYDEE